ncbi:hypothetical protein OIU74_014232 [Salix koriyanagi]|uniref:Uncharacterized protein n=1 Tax=Salix koriyanagi TaxID=2511006 RepID=A0A9Q0SZP8_9ROSI|nr:hypothetical protein OIU74_014232 [Salix koriyanagi]
MDVSKGKGKIKCKPDHPDMGEMPIVWQGRQENVKTGTFFHSKEQIMSAYSSFTGR